MKTTIILLLTLLSFLGYGQKQITITQSFQTVPKGKVWRLNMELDSKSSLMELSKKEGAFFQIFYFSTHVFHFIGNVVSIDPGGMKRNNHLVVGDSLLKTPYANIQTYSVKLAGAVNPQLMEMFTESIGDSKNMNWMSCLMPLEFKEGTQVAVSDCIKTMQLVEYPAN
jgi:hypothetical protein